MLEVTSAEYIDGYRIRVCFNTGVTGVVDLEDALWGPVFEPLGDLKTFRQLSVSEVLHTICWGNDADLAPEFLHDRMVEQGRVEEVHPKVSPKGSNSLAWGNAPGKRRPT